MMMPDLVATFLPLVVMMLLMLLGFGEGHRTLLVAVTTHASICVVAVRRAILLISSARHTCGSAMMRCILVESCIPLVAVTLLRLSMILGFDERLCSLLACLSVTLLTASPFCYMDMSMTTASQFACILIGIFPTVQIIIVHWFAVRSCIRFAVVHWMSSRCCLLLALSHDELGVIVDGLADPLEPVVAVALSITCKGLRAPLRAALEVLKERHAMAAALCRKVEMTCAEVRTAEELDWRSKGLNAADMATLNMILRTNGMPRLKDLTVKRNGFGDAGVQALFEGLGPGDAPSLVALRLDENQLGLASAETIAVAILGGAVPHIESLILHFNPIGNQGVAVLAAPLRKLDSLGVLGLGVCQIGDEGVASLLAGLDEDDFPELQTLRLAHNNINDAGMATIAAALNAGGLPMICSNEDDDELFLAENPAFASSVQLVLDAVRVAMAKEGLREQSREHPDKLTPQQWRLLSDDRLLHAEIVRRLNLARQRNTVFP